MSMEIGVIGVGYVGLVTATCFAHLGFKVNCVDLDENKIENLKNGRIPIHEPGLEEILHKVANNKQITFSIDINDLAVCNVIFLAVGTPPNRDGSANLSFLSQAFDDLAKSVKKDTVIVIKSTVPVGTAQMLRQRLAKLNTSYQIHIVSNPEFLREGNAVHDFLNPDRVVIGFDSSYSKNVMKELYAPFTSKDIPIVWTCNASAELIKYASNAYLAMRVGFINEISDLCEKAKADITEVTRGVGLDHRIGRHYLHPGPGFGGSCFPKDTQSLVHFARQNDVDAKIISAIMPSNQSRIENLSAEMCRVFKENNCNTIAFLGVTFKADTDDMRDSPTIPMIQALLDTGFEVRAYDPSNTEQFTQYFDIKLLPSIESALSNADAAVIATEWSEFKLLSPEIFVTKLKHKFVYDLRGMLSAKPMRDAGLKYRGIGQVINA